MNALDAALAARLLADTDMAALLAVYGTTRAVFVDDAVPGDCHRPYLIATPIIAVPFDTKQWSGEEISYDITGVTDRAESPTVLGVIMARVRQGLHRVRLTVPGYGVLIAICTGAVTAPSDQTLRARSCTATFTLVPD